MTDIAPNIEPNDQQRIVQVLAYIDLIEIEGIIATIGWNIHVNPKEWRLVEKANAYGKDFEKQG